MTELRGWTRPRPVRIAFLVENGEHSALMLDGIFADCYARWGGRFSLIVPCVNQQIPAAYWPWLEHYDPDIVFSYFALSDAATIEIHERLGPAEICVHRPQDPPRLDVFGFKPDYRFQPLKSLSCIFRVGRFRTAPGQPLQLLDSWFTERPSRFLTDNFGTYYNSEGTGMYPPDANSAAERLAIISPERQANRQNAVPKDVTTVPNELEGFRAVAERRATCMALLSAHFAPKLNIQFGQWSGTFNLVVGDSFADRILFWNARLLIPEWLDNNFCCVRIDPVQLEDPLFLGVLTQFINHHNHVNPGGGGPSQSVLRSCSLPAERLTTIETQLRQAQIWGATRVHAVASVDEIIPSTQALSEAREGNRVTGDPFPGAGWKSFVWTAPVARPPADEPDHLTDAPLRQHFTTGFWANDISLELESPSYRLDNRWMLPQRWRMAAAFTFEYHNQPAHQLPPRIRTSRFGRLTAFLNVSQAIAAIQVPPIRDAFGHAFVVEGRYAGDRRVHGEVVPPAKAVWLKQGNEDSYLTGVLGLAGGLSGATAYLLHPFLQSVFAELGGAPNPSGHALTMTDNRLGKWSHRPRPVDLGNVDDRNWLSSLILRAARELKRPKSFVTLAHLRTKWDEFRADYWRNQPHQRGDSADHEAWEKNDRDSLDACLVTLRDRQLLFQGHRWICERCKHHNWQDFNDLSTELHCSVCKQERRAAVEVQWLFRPNEFLVECLSQHSTMSLVWLIDILAQRAQHSFFYAGPTWFGYSRAEKPDSEADLLAVVDGTAYLCEAKSSWRDVRGDDIDAFEKLALRLRPDVAVLAVMEAGDGLRDRLAHLRGTLEVAGIKFELVLPREFDIHAHPYLPHEW